MKIMSSWKIIIRILLSVLIVFATILICILSAAIGGSSHHISSESRASSVSTFWLSIVLMPILITLIWLPWKKIFKKM